MYKNTPRTYFMGGATPTDMTMINRGVFFMGGADTSTKDWKQPSDWSDIRKDCPANSIALYAGHTADYSQYDNLGFTATCTGGYNVFIDGVQYGSTYASGAQCSITWSTSGITTGDDITTPSALKAHKIWIEPATEGNNITAFKHQRVGEGSDYEQQGTLWIHFNITNAINLDNMCSPYPYTFSPHTLTAVTAKNNIIDCGNSFVYASFNNSALTYVPTIKNGSITSIAFNGSSIEKVELDSCSFGDNSNYCFNACHNLKDVKLKNPTFLQNGKFVYTFYETMLKTFPANWDWTNVVEAQDIWTDYDRTNNNGTPTVIDARAATGLKILGIHDTNTLVGLRVSSSAPFNSATTPQIDVHNTALDRTALVQLFNDLPTVSDGQIINITGCTGALDLTADDIAIADNKGWTVVGGPELTTYYRYTHNSDNIYVTDDPVNYGNFNQPALTSNGTVGGDTCAVETNIPQLNENRAWHGFDDNDSTQFHSTEGNTVGYFTFYSPTPINVTKITFTNQYSATRASAGGTIYGSNDNNNWETITTYTHSNDDSVWDIDLSSNTNFYKYYKVYSNGTRGDSYWTFTQCTFTATVEPSIIYNSNFQVMEPQPEYTTSSIGLYGNVVGTLQNNNGVYSGFADSTNYVNAGQNLKSTNNAVYEFKTKIGNSFSTIASCDKLFSIGIRNQYVSTYNYGTNTSEGRTYLGNDWGFERWFKIEINGTTKTFSMRKDTDANYTVLWTGEDTGMDATYNSDLYLGSGPNMSAIEDGWLDLASSSATLNNVKTPFYDTNKSIVINGNHYLPNGSVKR